MQIALLLDGNRNPISMQIDTPSKFIATPRLGVVANFELVPKLSDDKVLIYRRTGLKMSDDEFKQLAHDEADPYRRPQVYRNIQRESLHGIAV